MMSGHLCLKWNNHSLAFLKSISTIQIKEKYCDATIACQGKYFSVHRVILSTCSDYFDEIFDRMECPHPYIVFKDIDPGEMELLLNYMYQGEVNVVQEKLPSLIKAAEALKIKGLAIPDDMPSDEKPQSTRKRKATSADNSDTKRRSEGSRRSRRNSHTSDTDLVNENSDGVSSEHLRDPIIQLIENQPIKEEPLEEPGFDSALKVTETSGGKESNSFPGNELFFNEPGEDAPFMKTEEPSTSNESFENQTSWPDFTNTASSALSNLSAPEMRPEDIDEMKDDGSDTGETELIQEVEPDWVIQQTCSIAIKVGNRTIHKCSTCGYSSYMKHKLTRHMRVHTGEKPYQCSVCLRRFARSCSLGKHKKNVNACKHYLQELEQEQNRKKNLLVKKCNE